MNPLSLALIGLPIVIGIGLRFRLLTRDAFEKALAVHLAIFGLVGIGYAFVTFGSTPSLIVDHQSSLVGRGIITLAGIVAFYVKREGISGAHIFISALFGSGFWLFLAKNVSPHAEAAAATLACFLLVALFNTLLGTIATGLALASLLSSYTMGSPHAEFQPWKLAFQLLGIDSDLYRAATVAGVAILGMLEKLFALLELRGS